MNVVKEPINLGMSNEDACKGDPPDYLNREAVAFSLELGTG
jgi:hypothetical protein